MKAQLLNEMHTEAKKSLDALGSRRVVVWGAGELGSWLMGALGPNGVAFVDKNPTKLGTQIADRPVHHPDELNALEFDEVWVAVLSDSAGIGEELAALGVEYRLVFPGGKALQVRDQLPRTLEFLGRFDLVDRSVLEVGCGGQLFLALTLAHLGAARVLVCDVGALGDALEKRRDEWLAFAAHLEGLQPTGERPEDVLARIELEARPVDAARLPHAAASFDAVVNTGVMEHVTDPKGAVLEFARVLRPGGLALCLAVGIHDHRANDPASGYTPWSFLEVDGAAWADLGGGAYHQNRWRAVEFSRAFERAGFDVLEYRTTGDARLRTADVRRFAPEFRARYTLEQLAELDLFLGARWG